MSSAPVAINGLNEQTGSDEIALREPLYVFAVSDLLNSSHDRRSERIYELNDNRPLARPNKILMSVDKVMAHMCYVYFTLPCFFLNHKYIGNAKKKTPS
jgi:hypothetical protein